MVIGHWDSMTAVDALLDAIERGDQAAVRSLIAGPEVRAALDGEIWTRLEVLACMAVSGGSEIAAEAVTTIRAEPQLALARFGGGETPLHPAAGGSGLAVGQRLPKHWS